MTSATTQIALMVTRRCDMACSHCSVASGPHIKDEPTEESLLHVLQEAAAAGVRVVTLTGGEPMLREEVLLRLLRECRKLGLGSRVVSDGFWGKTPADARNRLQALRKAGLGLLTLSHDRYHGAFQDHHPVLNIARAAEDLLFRIDIHLVRGADDSDLARLVEPFQGLKHVRLRFYDLQPVGRARLLTGETFRGEVGGFCSSCAFPAVTDDGRLLACNGPAYFSRPGSPLQVGSMKDSPLRILLERHWSDPVLDTIRTFGPARLRDELSRIPGFEQFPFKDRYSGMCDVCHHITGNPEAVSALRARLGEPARVAERQAVSLVIQRSRTQGALSRQYVNSVGVCRVFYRSAWEDAGKWTDEADRVLGRADVDWTQLATYLAECGLARPLAETVKGPVLARWAPPFFRERLASRAAQDIVREQVQRDALHSIAVTLREMGEKAVLLNGSMLPLKPKGHLCRATSNLELHVQPRLAASLRSTLLKHGFRDVPGARRADRSHVAPVLFGDVAVVFHPRLMPPWWNLPERDMLARSRPVEGVHHDAFSTLDPEGLVLHAGMQAATHLFSCGLKTAWDLRWILTQTPTLDWDRLGRWIEASRMPRGFRTTVGVLAESLELPFPVEFLRRGPTDKRQSKLNTIARNLLFTAQEEPQELNPFSKSGVLLLLHDSWSSRMGYLAALTRRELAEPTADPNGKSPFHDWTKLLPQLREAHLNWRGYRITLEQRRRILESEE